MNDFIIYKTTNLINNKIYVGKEKHYKDTYLGSGKRLLSSVKHHGKENFKKEILEHCLSESDMAIQETKWIKIYKEQCLFPKGYNLKETGVGGDTFSCQSERNKDKIRKRISAMSKGRVIGIATPEIREKYKYRHVEGMHKLKIRRSLGIFTERELQGARMRKQTHGTKKMRKLKSLNAKGIKNSQWAGYIKIQFLDGSTRVYQSAKETGIALGVWPPLVLQRARSNTQYLRGPLRGCVIQIMKDRVV